MATVAMKLHYEIKGSASKPPLLMLHGFLSSNLQWHYNVEALLPHFRLIMVELWGHGRSPAPQQEVAYTASRYLDQYEALRRQLGIQRWHVLGQSYGGGLAARYAMDYPAACKSLILTNSRAAIGNVPSSLMMKNINPNSVNMRSFPFHPINAQRIEASYKAALVAAADKIEVNAALEVAKQTPYLCERTRLGELRHTPFTFIYGIWEKTLRHDVQNLRAVLPNASVVEVEAGHSVNIDNPAAFQQAVIAHLDGCR